MTSAKTIRRLLTSSAVAASPLYGDALTDMFWGGSPTELQACAYISGHGFHCAWTANDGNS
jgi:hypothetical protein